MDNNDTIQHKPVKQIKDKRRYDRQRDRKDKRLYEVDDTDEVVDNGA